MARPLTFRFRILALVLGVAIVPLVLIGALLLRGAARSGERLLTERLEQAADDTREALIRSWIPLRSRLLDASEWPEVNDAVERGSGEPLKRKLLDLDPRIRRVVIRGDSEESLFEFDRSAFAPDEGGLPPASSPLMRVRFDLDRAPTRLAATESASIEFGLEGELLLRADARPVSAAGMVLSLVDLHTRASLLPIPLDASVLDEKSFTWGKEEWLTSRRTFRDPPLEVVLAAPVAPYVEPLRGWVRSWTAILAAVAVAAILGAIVLTSRMTRSLRALVGGVEAVSAGDLSHRIAYRGQDEVGRVARAFNNMAESLQRTLREQASRESLAAVGEFAASLAHEVRNPLTAVKIDLQSLEERMGDDPSLAQPLQRVLEEIDRLDSTVGDALSIVRQGEGDQVLDIWRPIQTAAHSAAPALAQAGATLDVSGRDSELLVLGDAARLEQLFLNLLLNAAEALARGGRATISTRREGDTVIVRVEDDGPGISEHVRDRIFEPLFSTKEAGTGLGLTISRRIVEAHRGGISVCKADGGGTCVEVHLPAAAARTPPTSSV